MDLILLCSPIIAVLATIVSGLIKIIRILFNNKTGTKEVKENISVTKTKDILIEFDSVNSKNTYDILFDKMDSSLPLLKDNLRIKIGNEYVKNKSENATSNTRRLAHEEY